MNEGEHRPDSGQNDHCEKSELGGHAGSLKLGGALAQEAKSAQAQGGLRIKQPTVRAMAAES